MIISSRQNEKIKEIKSLTVKKNRIKQQTYIVEGLKMVNEAIKYEQNVQKILCVEQMLESLLPVGVEIILCTMDVYLSVSEEVNPQGVLALISMPSLPFSYPKGNCLLLDGISDPGNLGTIIRTAVACGFKDLYLINCVDAYNGKTIRSSMSGIYFANLFIGGYELLSFIDCPIICGDMNGENVFTFNKIERFCLAIGSEGNGLSSTVKDRADFTVKIPMESQMESLNAGVSCGILMYILKKEV